MDLLKDDVGKLYRKFFTASFGSALIACIYGLVDMAMVGQYHGPDGSAAMAVISPIWNIIYSFGLLCGIGGSVIYAVARGERDDEKEANGYFTSAFILGISLSLILWVAVWVFEEPLLRLFGANDALMPLCKQYLTAPKLTVPVYVFTNLLSSFLRNDGDPGRATKAVIFGGIFNVFGDYFFVFTLDMGIKGAGIATAMGASMSVLVMLTHFIGKKNTLKFVKPRRMFNSFKMISVNGFSSFIVDVAMGIATMLFNRRVMEYLGTDALAVYGVIVVVSTLVQCCSYGIGQAAQPVISRNFGARLAARIKTMLKYNIITAAVFGIIWTVLAMAMPQVFIKLFMTPTPEVLSIAPKIIRIYAISFVLLPFNIYSTYYFQAIMRAKISLIISVARGIVISGALILLLPVAFGGSAVWWAMPVTEVLVFIYSVIMMKKEKLSR